MCLRGWRDMGTGGWNSRTDVSRSPCRSSGRGDEAPRRRGIGGHDCEGLRIRGNKRRRGDEFRDSLFGQRGHSFDIGERQIHNIDRLHGGGDPMF